MNNNFISAITVYNNQLYVGGNFSTTSGSSLNYIAKWNGTSWDSVGAGTNYFINTLTVYNGSLYAGGGFDSAGGNLVNHIAKWDGTNWNPVGSGTNSTIRALYVYNGDFYAGGNFDSAGSMPANSIAKWNSPVGIEEVSSSNYINIFPNPSTGEINFSFNDNADKSTLSIVNILGEEVFIKTLSASEHRNFQLSQKFASRVYTVILKTADKMNTKKLCIE